MDFTLLSLFPEVFHGPLNASMLKKAQERGLIAVETVDLRNFGEGKHRQVDDRPYGGGPGMVLMAPPLCEAINRVRRPESYVIYLSPQGVRLDARKCQELAKRVHLILLCGHYEGIDERVIELEVDEEISIGDYVLTNGALAAMVVVDGVARFVPGVLGHPEAAARDSFQEGVFDCPHYTRPEEFRGKRVPPVLLGGNHAEIERWRRERAMEKTQLNRPDLYAAYKESIMKETS